MKFNQPGITHFSDFRPAKHNLIRTVIRNQLLTLKMRIFFHLCMAHFTFTNQSAYKKNMCMQIIFLKNRPGLEPVIKITVIKCYHDAFSGELFSLIKRLEFCRCHRSPVIFCEPFYLLTKYFR